MTPLAIPLTLAHGAALPLAINRRSLQGLPYVSISAEQRLRLAVPSGIRGHHALILVPAVDGREVLTLRIDDEAGRAIASMVIPYPTVGERLSVPLGEVPSATLTVRVVSAGTLHVLHAPDGAGSLTAVAPHLLRDAPGPLGDAERVAAMARHLDSAAAWGLWGWMAGCVYDGLDAWGDRDGRWHAALGAHLDRHLIGASLRYESPRSEIADDHLHGIESCLPFAAVARHRPGHPSLELFRRFVRKHSSDGGLIDGATTSAEGNYTVAWPLIRLAEHDRQAVWRELAWDNLRLRRDRLWAGGALHLRRSPHGVTYRGWSRGIAWYLLGLLRSLASVPRAERPSDLVTEAERALTWVAGHQRADGLWANFLEEAALDADTAGSAGIGAALALAARAGLPGGDHERAWRCWQALAPRADASGYPVGVAPNNKAQGGEDLQRQPGRSSIHFGLGLVAQLAAQLDLVPGSS